MQIVKLSVPVPTIGPAVDVHVRTERLCSLDIASGRTYDRCAWLAAYDRASGTWSFPSPTSREGCALLTAAGVTLR